MSNPEVHPLDVVGQAEAAHQEKGSSPRPKLYTINEVFYSLQGEGVRAGTANVFVRFTGCNLRCSKEPGPLSPGGFDCDTEFMSGRRLDIHGIYDWVLKAQEIANGSQPMQGGNRAKWLILTGGEPGLQVDSHFCEFFHSLGYKLAIETNGTIPLPMGADSEDPAAPQRCLLDWVTVSPKVAEHVIAQLTASEVKYVRAYGQGVPVTRVQADHYLISPAVEPDGSIHPATMKWCINLCLMNPKWRLSCQQHKAWSVR